MKRFTFSVPQNILFGEGVLKELPGAAGKLGGKHGFIISGPTLNRLGVVGQCEEILTQVGIAVSTFCDTEVMVLSQVRTDRTYSYTSPLSTVRASNLSRRDRLYPTT